MQGIRASGSSGFLQTPPVRSVEEAWLGKQSGSFVGGLSELFPKLFWVPEEPRLQSKGL